MPSPLTVPLQKKKHYFFKTVGEAVFSHKVRVRGHSTAWTAEIWRYVSETDAAILKGGQYWGVLVEWWHSWRNPQGWRFSGVKVTAQHKSPSGGVASSWGLGLGHSSFFRYFTNSPVWISTMAKAVNIYSNMPHGSSFCCWSVCCNMLVMHRVFGKWWEGCITVLPWFPKCWLFKQYY